jgi:putative (di)nucleoside polyphosphate hydrolase
MINEALYRPCVGIILLHPQLPKVFVGRRIDNTAECWQMPQGGIDLGETPEQAAIRELQEETGTDKAVLLDSYPGWLYYDLPPELQGKLWGGQYIGQSQRWLLFRFTGGDADINLMTTHPEFNAWQWIDIDQLPEVIVPFKRELYIKLKEWLLKVL